MTGKVIRLLDYDKKSRQPDSAGPRDPADADVIVLEQVRSGKGKTAISSVLVSSAMVLPSNDFLFFGTYPDY